VRNPKTSPHSNSDERSWNARRSPNRGHSRWAAGAGMLSVSDGIADLNGGHPGKVSSEQGDDLG
jgi:hypothetical protein